MKYTTVALSVDAAVRVPAEHADDEDRRQAHAWLVRLAAPHYTRMLTAERDGQIPVALRAARAATRYGAFVPQVVTSAFLVATKHGDFELAQQLLSRLRTLELDEADDYEALLQRRVERWNRFLGDPAALRDAYRQHDVSPSYRELLLLVDRLDTAPSAVEQRHLRAFGLSAPVEARPTDAPDGTFSQRSALVMAVLVGALLGSAGVYLGQGRGEPTVSESSPTASAPVPDSLVPRPRYATALQVSTHLAKGQALRAYRALDRLAPDSAQTEAVHSLRTATHEALYRAGRRAWEAEDYDRVVQALTPIRTEPVGNTQDRLYQLGMAAAQTGRDTLAVDVLRDLMPQIDERHPHYEAQAAYLLVRLGPPDLARRYAQLIADKYADTLYFNSVVRARLDGD